MSKTSYKGSRSVISKSNRPYGLTCSQIRGDRVSDLCKEHGSERDIFYRYVGPNGELRDTISALSA
ncbi:hypothetical protein FBQ99_20330 [Chloroflexi bacterium CFX2]|nr:hypothetical protein [Chloroflexi bacterium CFX2]MXS80740.1 hypothetical protein [Nitrosomonas sp. GH22]